MQPTFLVATLAALGAAWALPAPASAPQQGTPQQAAAENATGLTRVPAPETEWEKALTASSHDERERSYERVVRAALDDAGVRDTLEAWAADASLGELSWTARLALREVDLRAGRAPRRGLGQRSRGGDPFGWFDSPFGQFELFTHPDFMDEMRRQMDAAMQGLGTPGAGSTSRAKSFSLESSGDGVRVEVREDIDGEESVTTYEADSLEELLEQNPELRDQIGSGPSGAAQLFGPQGGFAQPFFGSFGRRGSQRGFAPAPRRVNPGQGLQRVPLTPAPPAVPGAEDEPGVMRTDRLGVYVSEPGRWNPEDRGLARDVGLLVERALPNSLAEALGIRAGDVVAEMNGEAIRTADDIARVLEERAPEGALTVTVVDGRGQRRTTTWEPAQRL